VSSPTDEQKSEYYRMSRKSNFEGSMSLMSSSPNVMIEEKVSHLSNLTDEQRVEMREKAAESKRIAVEYAQNNLKLEYAEMNHWESIARSYNIRQPQAHFPAYDIKYMRRIANKIGFDIDIFVRETGFKGLKQFAEANPTWSARAVSGLVLECFTEYKKNPLQYVIQEANLEDVA